MGLHETRQGQGRCGSFSQGQRVGWISKAVSTIASAIGVFLCLTWLLLCLWLPSRAQTPQVTITGTYYAIGASGSTKANGTVTLNLQAPIESSTNQTATNKLLYQIVNGAYTLKLPPGTYTAAYEIQSSPSSLPTSRYTRTWTVPGAGGPYTIADVEVPGPAPAYPLQPSGIAPGLIGQCLYTITGPLVSWQYCNGLIIYSQPVTNQTSVTVTAAQHKLPSSNLIALCGGIGECGEVNLSVDGSDTIIVTSITPWSGTLYILTSPISYNLAFSSSITASVLWPIYGLSSIAAVACYDSSNNQFGAGAITLTPHDFGLGGSFAGANDFSINLSASVPVTGRCSIIGN